MKRLLIGLLACSGGASLLAQPSAAPFKLGTFGHAGRTFPGIVLADTSVVDIAAANAALESRHSSWPRIAMPDDMKDLIARYASSGLKGRLYAIASESRGEAPYVYPLAALTLRPPVLPGMLLNAAVNYTEHESEMTRRPGAGTAPPPSLPKSIPGLWERRPDDTRHNPYLFLKGPNAVIAAGEAIRIPPGRDRVDWECEMTLVIGREATRVPVERAADYIFGYTLQNDVSDRGERGDGRHGSDWLVAKSHDTFAPLGPFIVPSEFIKDPQNLPIRFSLNGQLMQDSTTARMTHSVHELVSFASHVITLRPGDAIATGSSAGVGVARTPPIFMKAGDRAVCSVEGIGTLASPVVGPEATTGKAPR